MPTPEVTGSAALHSKEIKKIAKEYALKHSSAYVTASLIESIINGFTEWLSKDNCIVSREFIKRQRLIVEHHKKMMLEMPNPIGEQIALAGVYQAKLELMDNLFGSSLFEEEK